MMIPPSGAVSLRLFRYAAPVFSGLVEATV
jgi:hypothetical protein